MPEGQRRESPNVIHDLGDLTKDTIRNFYLQILRNPETRKNHMTFTHVAGASTPIAPTPLDVERDFRCWYDGVYFLGFALDSSQPLPPVSQMVTFITQDIQLVKEALAA